MVEKRKPNKKQGHRPYHPDKSRKDHKNFAKFRGRIFTAKDTGAKERRQAKTSGSDKVRVIVLGGLEEVGRNCTLIEYKNDIIIIDMGLQFPEENMPGVDYIIPNMDYLKGKEKNVRGVIITHGHYDHIGGIPHIMPNIGNPPLYAMPLTAGIIKKRQQDFHTGQLNLKVIKSDQVLQLGVFKVSFYDICHNIPDSVGVVVETPAGTICHTGDWKFDFHPAGGQCANLQQIAKIGEKGVTCLMGDSTNAGVPGHQVSERVIGEELQGIIEKAEGRVIIGTFASLVGRVKQILEISESLGKKVALDGFSMKTNVEIAKELGYIKISNQSLIKPEQIDNYPPEKIVMVCTGAQGESNAALNRIANGEHRSIKIIPGDTIVFSSSVVPGNETAVQRLQDTLYRQKAKVINYSMMDVHAGGHAKSEDVKLLIALLKPTYYMPIEGNRSLLHKNAEVAYAMGYDENHVFMPDNGQVVEFSNGRGVITNEKVVTDYVFVDGLGVGDVSQVVIRDRQVLAGDGMVVLVAQIDKKNGQLIGSPDIISRGFIYMKENREMIEATRKKVREVIAEKDSKAFADTNAIRNKLRDEIGLFLFKKTERRPMILPVIIEV
ncbi:ribonuclease J [Patescibacteria group bacterium]|nr:ribonuclease J [Patescibacteria group bacterium]MBU1705531.1 ribonuclease J [Patescibacteria group bacterium]